MENLIEYKRFTDIETVAEITEILDKNKIPYEVIDKSRGFTLVATDMNPYDQQIILKIKKTDFNRVDKISRQI